MDEKRYPLIDMSVKAAIANARHVLRRQRIMEAIRAWESGARTSEQVEAIVPPTRSTETG